MTISLESANLIYKVSNTCILFSAAFTLLFTFISNKMTDVKEYYSNQAQLAAAPRSLNFNQLHSLMNSLKSFAGKKILVTMYPMDAESKSFSDQIIECLQAVGISVDDSRLALTVEDASIMKNAKMPLMGVYLSGCDTDLIKTLSENLGQLVTGQ